MVRIADTGPGIDAEERSRIFDPGYTTKGVGVGTGLGLPIVKELVTSLGGLIELQSELGKGSTFTVLIPQSR